MAGIKKPSLCMSGRSPFLYVVAQLTLPPYLTGLSEPFLKVYYLSITDKMLSNKQQEGMKTKRIIALVCFVHIRYSR
jgi:hypothetical protein